MRERFNSLWKYVKNNRWSILLLVSLFFFGVLLLNLIPNFYFIFKSSQSRIVFVLVILMVVFGCLSVGALCIFSGTQKGIKLFAWCLLRCLLITCMVVGMIILFSYLTFSIRKSFIFGKDSMIVKLIPMIFQYVFFPFLSIAYLHALTSKKVCVRAYLISWITSTKKTLLWIVIIMFIFVGMDVLIQCISNEVVSFVASALNTTALWVFITEIYIYKIYSKKGEQDNDSENIQN